jgi:LysR family transcriptional regulator, nitrogen assimilation regulatory protein
MDIRQLNYLVHIADNGSFTKAAALLGVAQPALSRQVRSLEIELGQTLLYRNGRGVSPTEAGKRLLAHARGILNQLDRAREELQEMKGAPHGRVVVGAPPTVAKMLAVPLVKEFRSRFPRASLGIVEGLSVYVHEWLLIGRIDIALLYNPVPSPAIDILPFIEEDLYLIRPMSDSSNARAKTIRLRDLAKYPLIIPSRPHAIRMQVETTLANLGLKPAIALEIDGVAAILDLVAQGHGYAALPFNSISQAGGSPRLHAQAIVPSVKNKLSLAVSAQRPSTPLATQTLTMIRDIGKRVLQSPQSTRLPPQD